MQTRMLHLKNGYRIKINDSTGCQKLTLVQRSKKLLGNEFAYYGNIWDTILIESL